MGRMSVDRESMRAATACLVRCLARGRGCKRGTGARSTRCKGWDVNVWIERRREKWGLKISSFIKLTIL